MLVQVVGSFVVAFAGQTIIQGSGFDPRGLKLVPATEIAACIGRDQVYWRFIRKTMGNKVRRDEAGHYGYDVWVHDEKDAETAWALGHKYFKGRYLDLVGLNNRPTWVEYVVRLDPTSTFCFPNPGINLTQSITKQLNRSLQIASKITGDPRVRILCAPYHPDVARTLSTRFVADVFVDSPGLAKGRMLRLQIIDDEHINCGTFDSNRIELVFGDGGR